MDDVDDIQRARRAPRRTAGHALAACVSLLVACAALAAPAHAAAPNDAVTSPQAVPTQGLSQRVDTTGSGIDAGDPVPSCNSGARAAGSAWYVIRTGARARTRVHIAVQAPGGTAVAALYAVAPVAGTELTCTRAAAAGAAAPPIEHVLAAKMTYILQVGLQGTMGGVLDVTVGRVATTWSATTPISARRQGIAVAGTADGAVYAFGGYQVSFLQGAQSNFHSEAVNRRNPATGAWTVVAQLPVGLSYARAVRVGKRIYLPGGQSNLVNGAGCITKTHLAFDPRTKRFASVASHMGPLTFDYAAAGGPGGRVYYMVGGMFDPTPCDVGATVDDRQVTGAARVYDVKRNTWTELAPMASPRQGAAAGVMNGGWLYVAGGLAGQQASAALEVYDPKRRIWYRGPNLPVPVYGAAAGVGWDARGREVLYVAGGWTHTNSGRGGTAGETTVTQVFDPRTLAWKVLPTTTTARDAIGSAVVGGHLYAVGGYQGQAIRAVDRLKVDTVAPNLRVLRSARGDALVLRAVASDGQSGIARVTWKLPGGRTAVGMNLRLGAGRRHGIAVVTAFDVAGNTRRVRVSV